MVKVILSEKEAKSQKVILSTLLELFDSEDFKKNIPLLKKPIIKGMRNKIKKSLKILEEQI